MKKSGQSALDYLLSWGWVLIVIAASLIVLYSLGVFSAPSAPTLISGFPTVSVSAVAANSSLMVLKLSNNFGSPINLSDISVSISGKNYTALQCQKTILPQSQSALCRVPVSISSSKYFAVVNINFLPYRSVAQLVSNGTISAGRYSGSLALNNEVTSFEAVDAPVGNSWAVTFDGVKKTQTVTSAPNGNIINFSEPFGVYGYNVSNLSASCSGAYPTPSKGTANTGALYKISFSGNCVTTFVEHGIPSSFNWQVNYSDPQSATAPAGTNLTFEAPVGVAYAYKAVPLSLACANSSVAVSGSVVNIDYWGCNTTISESNLPLGATGNGASSAVGWSMSFDGYNSPVSTSSSSLVTSKQVFSLLSPITPSASVSGLNCNGASAPSIYPGGSGTFSSWSCVTTLSESGVPLGATGDGASSTVGWSASFDGYSSGVSTSSSSVSTPAATFTSFSPITPSASVSGLDCSGASAPSIYPGGSGTFSSWSCTTTFKESGVPLGATGDGISGTLGWTAYYPAQSPTTAVASSTSSSILTYPDNGVSTISESNAGAGTKGLTCGGSNQYPTYLGGTASFSSWDCITSFSESGIPLGSSGGGITTSQLGWAVNFDGVDVNTSNSSSNLIYLQRDISSISTASAQADTVGLNCISSSSPSIYEGASVALSGPWLCTNTIDENGIYPVGAYSWSADISPVYSPPNYGFYNSFISSTSYDLQATGLFSSLSDNGADLSMNEALPISTPLSSSSTTSSNPFYTVPTLSGSSSFLTIIAIGANENSGNSYVSVSGIPSNCVNLQTQQQKIDDNYGQDVQYLSSFLYYCNTTSSETISLTLSDATDYETTFVTYAGPSSAYFINTSGAIPAHTALGDSNCQVVNENFTLNYANNPGVASVIGVDTPGAWPTPESSASCEANLYADTWQYLSNTKVGPATSSGSGNPAPVMLVSNDSSRFGTSPIYSAYVKETISTAVSSTFGTAEIAAEVTPRPYPIYSYSLIMYPGGTETAYYSTPTFATPGSN
jgi:hypothetical protein